MHWSDDIRTDVDDSIDETAWKLVVKGDKGPLEFTHSDGSVVTAVSSSITGGYAVTYEPAAGVDNAVTDEHTSWQSLDNMGEWLVHVLDRHVKLNE